MHTLEITRHRAVGRDTKANPAFSVSFDGRIQMCGIVRPVKLVICWRSYSSNQYLC
jgi:hypothetical protein